MKSAEIPFASVLLLFGLLLYGCGSTEPFQPPKSPVTPTVTPTPPPAAPNLVVIPQGLEIRHGEDWNCSLIDKSTGATVDTAWSVQEGPAGGSITGDGVYTAPAANGVYHVIATLTSDASKTFTIPVTVGDGLTLSGDPGSARIGHTAALLPNGHVLISGGIEYSAYNQWIDRIDEYDPVTGVFAYVNSLKRSDDSVTVLANGDVLFAGGTTWARDASGKLTFDYPAAAQILIASIDAPHLVLQAKPHEAVDALGSIHSRQ